MTKAYKARETWLADAMAEMRRSFKRLGWTIPDKVRVSCGLPSVSAFGAKKRRIGEAWSSKSSRDQHHEIFISPTIDDPVIVLGVLVHELVHVTVGIEAGHKGKFVECARAVGLEGPWTATTASERLSVDLKRLTKDLGDYPHASLSQMTNGRKKQTTRLIKAGCPECGYCGRFTMMWLMIAIPTCPNESCEKFGTAFEVVLPDEEE
jgi:hypothetical protein